MTEHTKRRLLILAIGFSIIPAVLLVKFPSLVSLKTISLYLSAIFGYVGMVVLLWSYILGAKSVAGTMFKDLAPVLSIHKWLGKYGTLAIFIHPLLVMYSYGESILYTFIPQVSTQFERHVTLGRFAFLVGLLVWITSALLRDRITFRPWRYIHLLGYMMLPFTFLHVPDVGSQFMAHTTVKAYFFSMAVVFGIFTLLRLRGLLNIDKSPYRVVEQRQLIGDDPAVFLLRLQPEKDIIAPQPGQYVYLKDGALSEEHPFSVLGFNPSSGELVIVYRTFGRFTKEIAKRTVGARMWVNGPYGTFTQEITEDSNRPVVFIAGGIGITPMVRYIFDQTNREQWLFYANRTVSGAPLLQELRGHLGERLVAVFSRQSDGLDPTYERGHITADMIKKHITSPRNYDYYICGSDNMMSSVAHQLSALDVPATQIRREAFSW